MRQFAVDFPEAESSSLGFISPLSNVFRNFSRKRLIRFQNLCAKIAESHNPLTFDVNLSLSIANFKIRFLQEGTRCFTILGHN